MSKLVDKERLARLAAALDQRAKAAVKAEHDRAVGVEEALQADIDAINNPTTGILAEAKKHVAEEIKKVNAANEALDGRVGALEQADTEMQAEIDANKAAIGVLNGPADKAGSVAKAVADAKANLQGQIDNVVAKNNEQDTAIEAAQQQADKGVQDAAAVAARATALEEDVADHETRIAANKAAIDVLNGGADKAGSVAKAIADAVAPINTKNGEQDGRLDALEGLVSGDTGIAAVKSDIEAIKNKNNQQDTAIKAAKDQADKGVQDAAAVAARATALEEDVADHETRMVAVEKVADANEKAIAVLNGDAATAGSVDKKIADALTAYTDTDELKVMLGNVVNSLALSMEGNKLKLKLGGVEGITIHETSLDMATDQDIDDIIAGLDA